eukprot:gene11783-5120_t
MSKVPFKFTQFQTNTTFKGVVATQFNSDDPKKKHKFKTLFNQSTTTTNYFHHQKFNIKDDKSSYVGARIYNKPLNFQQKRKYYKVNTPNGNINLSKKFMDSSKTFSILVEYQTQKTLTTTPKKLGILTGKFEGEKYEVINSDGITEEINHKEVTYQWTPSENDLNSTQIPEIEIKCTNLKNQIPMEDIELFWRKQLNNRKSATFKVSDASNFFFNSENDYEIYSSYRILSKFEEYFRAITNVEFECKSLREVEEFKKKQKKRTEGKLNNLISLYYLLEKLDSQTKNYKNLLTETEKEIYEISSNFKKTENDLILQDLELYALGKLPQSKYQNVYEKYLKPLNFEKSMKSAYELCLESKIFKYQNIHLLRSPFNLDFSQEILKEAKEIKEKLEKTPDLDSSIRRDLRHLKSFAIDDKSTVDIDDAISIEFTELGSKIYVHIADATRFIHHESKLQNLAYHRVTSIYLPEKKISMIPKDLSEDVISLSSKKENFVLTFSFELSENGDISKYEIFPAIISKIKRISYEQLDSHFERNTLQEDESRYFSELMKFSTLREEFRIKNGAFNIPSLKPRIYVNSNGKVDLNISGFDSSSRKIVTECMIVANEISAKYAHEKSICVPYKGTFDSMIGDLKPEEKNMKLPKSIPSDDELVDLVMKIPKNLKYPRSCITQIPTFHEGLGVNAYTQVTSPIRKSWDLMVHYQIKSSLRGEEKQPLSWNAIQELLSQMESKKRLIQNLQNDSEKFWIIKFFEQNKEKIFKGVVLEVKEYNYAIEDEYNVNVFILENGHVTILTSKINHKIGSIIEIQVKEVDAFSSVLKFKEICK